MGQSVHRERKCWIKDEAEKTKALIVDKKQEIAIDQEKLAKSKANLADLQKTPSFMVLR